MTFRVTVIVLTGFLIILSFTSDNGKFFQKRRRWWYYYYYYYYYYYSCETFTIAGSYSVQTPLGFDPV